VVAQKPLVECGFLIPIHRDTNLSDGQLHGAEAWEWLEDQLNEFGGASRSTELYRGWYVDPDTKERIEDLSHRYEVAVPRRQVRRLRALLRRACLIFQQNQIYLSVAGMVEFVEGAGHGTD
jgi:hypothetical protein